METKDYVKILRLDQENFQFNRGEFMNKMGEDLLEVCQRQQKINPATRSEEHTSELQSPQ